MGKKGEDGPRQEAAYQLHGDKTKYMWDTIFDKKDLFCKDSSIFVGVKGHSCTPFYEMPSSLAIACLHYQVKGLILQR